ncbi:hypothetical protein ACIPUD_08450 [Bradyrhizobium sp. CAR08]
MSDVDAALKRLRALRSQLVARLNETDQTIAQLEKIQERIGRLTEPTLFDVPTDWPSATSRVRNATPPHEIADQAARLIEEAGRPLTRSQIVEMLKERGVLLVGSDVNKNVGTILWRQKGRFVNLPKLGYWLADKPLPGLYYPPSGSAQS